MYWTFNTAPCIKETNSKAPPKIIKRFPALFRGIGERVATYPPKRVADLGEGTERRTYRVQNRPKGCESLGRACRRWKEPSPSPAPWQGGKGCPPRRGCSAVSTGSRPPGAARTPGGRSRRGRQRGQTGTDKRSPGGRPRRSPAAPRSRWGPARPPRPPA